MPDRGRVDFPAEILQIVHAEHEDGCESVQGKHVDRLIAVHGLPWLGAAFAHEGHVVDVIVNPIDIGVCMVNDIMFQFPECGIAPEEIVCKSENFVDP
jgi:hypothetical protein